jgi:hypothetical protein
MSRIVSGWAGSPPLSTHSTFFRVFSYSHPAQAHSTLEEVVESGSVGACRYKSKVTADFISREIVHECVQQMPNSIAAAPQD